MAAPYDAIHDAIHVSLRAAVARLDEAGAALRLAESAPLERRGALIVEAAARAYEGSNEAHDAWVDLLRMGKALEGGDT